MKYVYNQPPFQSLELLLLLKNMNWLILVNIFGKKEKEIIKISKGRKYRQELKAILRAVRDCTRCLNIFNLEEDLPFLNIVQNVIDDVTEMMLLQSIAIP